MWECYMEKKYKSTWEIFHQYIAKVEKAADKAVSKVLIVFSPLEIDVLV